MYHLNSLFLLSYFQNELDMCKIKPRECQNVEFKSSWQEEFLKWICGFANAQGAGFIDTWGRGYKKIHDGFKKAGLPMPTVKSHCGGTLVTFQRGYDVISGRKNVTSGVTSDVSSSVSSSTNYMARPFNHAKEGCFDSRGQYECWPLDCVNTRIMKNI